MPKYMVELSHTPDECVLAFGEPDQREPDLLDEVFWGCMSGIHNGWVVVDADNEEQVRAQAPKRYVGELTITEVQVAGPGLEYAIDPTAAHPGEDPPFWS
jgi:hypothetical protein